MASNRFGAAPDQTSAARLEAFAADCRGLAVRMALAGTAVFAAVGIAAGKAVKWRTAAADIAVGMVVDMVSVAVVDTAAAGTVADTAAGMAPEVAADTAETEGTTESEAGIEFEVVAAPAAHMVAATYSEAERCNRLAQGRLVADSSAAAYKLADLGCCTARTVYIAAAC